MLITQSITLHISWDIKLFIFIDSFILNNIFQTDAFTTRIYLKILPYIAAYRKPNHSRKYQVPQWPGTCWTLKLTCKFFAWAESWVTLAWSSAFSVESFFFSVSSCVCCIVSSDTLFLSRTATVRSCNEQFYHYYTLYITLIPWTYTGLVMSLHTYVYSGKLMGTLWWNLTLQSLYI